MRCAFAVGAAAVSVFFFAVAGVTPAAAEGPDLLALSAGAFDVNDDETAAEGRVEYRSHHKLYFIGPMAGLMANSDGGVYGYGGIYIDIELGERVALTPSFAVGGYRRGDSKDLGSTIEFRSGVEIAWRFDSGARLGVAFHHISNAGIDDNNPGTESLVLTYAIPLGPLF